MAKVDICDKCDERIAINDEVYQLHLISTKGLSSRKTPGPIMRPFDLCPHCMVKLRAKIEEG